MNKTVNLNITEEDEFLRELEEIKKFGIKGSRLRTEYEEKVRQLKDLAAQLQQEGCSEEEIARQLHHRRRQLGEEYKLAAPPLFREYIYYATEQKYGDPLGPGFTELSKHKTYQEIIESSCRPIKNLDDRLTCEGFKEWYLKNVPENRPPAQK